MEVDIIETWTFGQIMNDYLQIERVKIFDIVI